MPSDRVKPPRPQSDPARGQGGHEPLIALLIEDNESDAELLLRELRRGYDVTFERVETEQGLIAALDAKKWDLVLADYSLPGFGAVAALSIVRDRRLDVPFIIVSGTVDEATAVEAMRAGAQDFVTKGNLARLRPAIDRELHDASVRADRREIRAQLSISERMASVGTLAAGVAHEINNPLGALVANLDVVLEDLAVLRDPAGPDEASLADRLRPVVEAIREAKEAAERVRLIVRDIGIFSHGGGEEQRGPVDLQRLLDSSFRMAAAAIRPRARVVKEYRDVPHVDANEARLAQVFLNLIVNAAQAIPEGDAAHNEIRATARVREDGRVVVEIADTGHGIPDEIVDRIFDPFFTTKPIGMGTGLGLAICHRIVTSLGGELRVKSEPGSGTVFTVILPSAASASSEG